MEWLLHTAARSFIFETILTFDDLFLLSAKNRVYEFIGMLACYYHAII